MITEEGVYEISEDDYHADRLMDVPTLSCSVAEKMVGLSPSHGRAAHPRLADKRHEKLVKFQKQAERRDKKLDLGDVAHQFLLGEGRGYVVLDPADYPNKDGSAPKSKNRAMGDAEAAVEVSGKTPVCRATPSTLNCWPIRRESF